MTATEFDLSDTHSILSGGDSAYTAPTDAVTMADISGLSASPNIFGGIDLAWTLNE